MLKFSCIPTGSRSALAGLHGAHLVAADGVPARGDIEFKDNTILCNVTTNEAVALSLVWEIPGFGATQIQTTRLPQREKPYNLQLELARHRLMAINVKREEWGLYDYSGMADITREIDDAKRLFISALKSAGSDVKCAELAEKAIEKAMWASEHLSRFHATVFLSRRQQIRGLTHQFLGICTPGGELQTETIPQIADKVDFVRVPFIWREIQPKEQGTNYDAVDQWIQTCKDAKLTIHGGPLLNFGVTTLPDWMYIWENDFDTVFELAREHVARTVKRYSKDVKAWVACSGLHANEAFSLNFENIIELTRMATTTTRKAAPRSQVIIDLTQPWGEYFARNPRTIPPLLYAEMLMQSGIPFDAFGLQFLFGVDSDGYHLRDLLQISGLIDRLANLGKSIHITGVCVPSACANGADAEASVAGGTWHEPWSEIVQADWLHAFVEIALSRPFVESVCLHTLADGVGNSFPSAGLLDSALKPKPALGRLGELRQHLRAEPNGQ